MAAPKLEQRHKTMKLSSGTANTDRDSIAVPGERGAFIRTIIANPEDDGPRLVYADWLDEQGECDRAEFIRVQCALPQLALNPNSDGILWLQNYRRGIHANQREQALFTPADWTAEFQVGLGIPYSFSTIPGMNTYLHLNFNKLWPSLYWDNGSFHFVIARGFVEGVAMPWALWIAHHAELLASAPLRNAWLTTWPPLGHRLGLPLPTSISLEAPTIELELSKRWPGITFKLLSLHGTR